MGRVQDNLVLEQYSKVQTVLKIYREKLEIPLDKIFGNLKYKPFKREGESLPSPAHPTPGAAMRHLGGTSRLQRTHQSLWSKGICGDRGSKVRPNSEGWEMKSLLAEFTVKSAPWSVGWDFLLNPDF